MFHGHTFHVSRFTITLFTVKFQGHTFHGDKGFIRKPN
jgi:hypothetical protein